MNLPTQYQIIPPQHTNPSLHNPLFSYPSSTRSFQSRHETGLCPPDVHKPNRSLQCSHIGCKFLRIHKDHSQSALNIQSTLNIQSSQFSVGIVFCTVVGNAEQHNRFLSVIIGLDYAFRILPKRSVRTVTPCCSTRSMLF